MKEFIKRLIKKIGNQYNTSTNSILQEILKIEKEKLIKELLVEPKYQNNKRLEKYGFRVYSQNDEDGIIQEIFHRIGTTNKIFVEFGVGDGIENNTLYLLLQGWKGLWIDGSADFVNEIKKRQKEQIDGGQLTIKNNFITKDNINDIISTSYTGEIDLLSIDIDGNDYYVLDAINCINPRVIIAEYNSKFPPQTEWIMKYDENHIWDGSDDFGMSFSSMVNLLNKKGYYIVGTNLTGVNAFFVRNDIVGKSLFSNEPVECLYNKPMYFLLQNSNGHPKKA